MHDRKLQQIEPGLIKLVYSFNGDPKQEIALKMSYPLGQVARLPNDVLCYMYWLRDGMKCAHTGGIKPIGPFGGHEVHDEHVENVRGKMITLTPQFCDFKVNYNPLLIPCNVPYYRSAIDELTRVLFEAGFDAKTSKWEDYKTWEIDKLKAF
jgi:hypothetical protein